MATTAAFEHELVTAREAAIRAGGIVRDLYERAAAAAFTKQDGSPVTEADLASDELIRSTLTRTFPADAILTEESADDPSRLESARCWIVDPIDGTQQFIDRTGEFDILIALTIDGRPAVAVTYQPTTGVMLSAVRGHGAWVEHAGRRDPLRLTPAARPPRLLTSKWLGAPASLPLLTRAAIRIGAAAPPISRLGVYARTFLPPANAYDALVGYPANGPEPMGAEWDLACSDLIVHEAGGRLTNLEGDLIRYNKPDPRNYEGLVLAVDPATHGLILAAIAAERASERAGQ